MRYLSNRDVEQILPMAEVIDSLRTAYTDLDADLNTYVPLAWLYAPTESENDYFRCSTVIGNAHHEDIVAIRIKSEIIGWPGDGTETKYAGHPGQFCGLILLFSTKNAVPLAVLQDGYIQHMRVGAASAIGADFMAPPDASTLGILGSGGMAHTHLMAMAQVRELSDVAVWSPTVANLERFVEEMRAAGYPVRAAASAESAVRDRDLVVSATDAIEPTFDPGWVTPGAHVTCIQKRELRPAMYDVADTVAKLGERAYPPDVVIPRMQRVRGGLSAFIAGTRQQQARIPRGGEGSKDDYPLLSELFATRWRRRKGETTLFLTGGTQGVQFAAVAGHALRIAEKNGLGQAMPDEWFVEDIRN